MYLIAELLTISQIFIKPLYVPTTAIQLLWALPICLAFATVYKAIKVQEIKAANLIKEVVILFATMIAFLAITAVVLLVIATVATG